MDTITELFGFLRYSKTIRFKGGEISIMDGYEDACKWIEEYAHRDGFIYPPISHTVEFDSITGKEVRKIPKTERPSLLHKLPISHKVIIEQPISKTNVREADASFLVHLLSYVFGTRLQFKDWWFDGRIPIKPTLNIHIIHSTIEDFVSNSYQTWKKWTDKQRKWFVNILIMYSRAPSYEWDWEHFIIEYMVFDGLFKLAERLYGCHAQTHKERFKAICNKFGIQFNKDLIERIYKLRNDLFHQSLWDRGQPCTGKVNSDAYFQPLHLRRFNARLIPAILGYNTPFIKTKWWYMGTSAFDKAKS